MAKPAYMIRAAVLAALHDAYPSFLSEDELAALPMQAPELETALTYLVANDLAERRHYEGDPIYLATGKGVAVHQKVQLDPAIHGPKYA